MSEARRRSAPHQRRVTSGKGSGAPLQHVGLEQP